MHRGNRHALEDLLGEEELRVFHTDTADARGLPGRAYSASFYAIEQQELFPKSWCAVAVKSDLPAPGDMLPVEVGGWPVLLLRAQTGELRAFHNVCRHRAMRLVTEPGNRDAIVCPWHAWRYALDGKLLVTPRVGGDHCHTQPGLTRAELGLVRVPVGCWNDLVFVNPGGGAAPFEEHIAPLDRLLAPFDLSGLERADSWEIEYPGNWKVAIEGAIEDYHLPVGHPQIALAAIRMNPELHHARACFYSNSTIREYAKPEDANPASGARFGLPEIPFDGDTRQRRTYFMNLFPTGMFQMHTHNAVQGLFLPAGPDRTRLLFNHYYVGEAARDDRYREERDFITHEWQKVFEQDIPFVHYVHENYRVRDAMGIATRFSETWEANVHEFQKAVIEVIGR